MFLEFQGDKSPCWNNQIEHRTLAPCRRDIMREHSILIKNAKAIATCNDSLDRLFNESILIRNNIITDIGTNIVPPENCIVINASSHVVIPGMVNTHHHFYQVLTRAVKHVQNAKLFDWLVNLYEIWRELTPEAVYYSSLAAMGELLLTGCTTSTDHLYLFPNKCNTELIDEQIKAAGKIGIRFHPTRGSMSRGKSKGGLPPDDVCQTEDEIIRDSIRLIDKYHDPSEFAMTRIALAPCSPFSVTPDLMKETAVLARDKGVRIHTHLAETNDEDDYCLKTYNKRPVEFMEELGWIGDDVWFAHCVYLNDREIALFAETGTGVAHCPSSNMRLASGIAPIPKMYEQNVPVGIAVDGSASNDASNMLGEARQALLLHRVKGKPDSTNVDMILDMATKGGARVLGRTDIGQISVGKAADLALFNMDRLPYAGCIHDPIASLLFCGANHIADYVLVNGKVVVDKGKIVFAEEDEIVEKVNKYAKEMVDKSCVVGSES